MTTNPIPLEDELGDVLEKGLRRVGLTPTGAAERSGVALGRILDAIDYRTALTAEELARLARALDLNEVGLCALGAGRYPLPEAVALPFCLQTLSMPHGIGVANAFLITEGGSRRGILFDTGPSGDLLLAEWPRQVDTVAAIFITHAEGEHAGGLAGAVRRFGAPAVFGPETLSVRGSRIIDEGEIWREGDLEVTTFRTPGHARAHNCYVVRSVSGPRAPQALVAGDLIFAGSTGGGYFCHQQLRRQLRRVLSLVPENTVIAPGHGPLTTVGNERRFNPFVS